MADYQRVVEDLQGFLNGNDQTLRDEIRDLADEYVQLASEANDRLRRCREYLDRSLRSEAIHVAEADPNLLDFVTVLDFEELPEWENFCADYALTPPPKLMLLVAEDLNAAYAAEQPLKEHLKQLRQLSLVKAPLDQRIAVMRQLAQLDPESHFWNEDIIVFEAARHEELEDEAREAFERADVDRLKELVRELQSDQWLQPPDEELVKRVKRLHAKISRRSGREVLDELLPELLDAYQQQDVDRGRRLRNTWDPAVKQSKLGPDDEHVRAAQPVMVWLSQLDNQAFNEAKYQNAVQNLVAELNRGNDALIETIERLRQEILSTGYALPPELEERCSATVNRQESAATWSRRLMLYGTATGVLLVVGLLIFFLTVGLQGRETAKSAEAIKTHIDDGNLEEARQKLDELKADDPGAFESGAIQDLVKILAKLEEEDETRAADFKRHADAADSYITAKVAEPAEDELAKATEVARLSSEYDRLTQLEVRLNLLKNTGVKNNETIVLANVTKATADLERVEELLAESNFKEADEKINAVKAQIEEAEENADGISTELAARLKDVKSSLSESTDKLSSAQQANLLENNIRDAVLKATATSRSEDLEAIDSRLEAYVEKFPGLPHTAGFSQARKEMHLAKATLDLSEIISQSLGEFENLARIQVPRAERLNESLDELLRQAKGTPDRSRISQYHEFIASVAERDTVDELLRTRSLGDTFVKKVTMLEKGGKRWYSPSPDTANGKGAIADKVRENVASIVIKYYTSASIVKEDTFRLTGVVKVGDPPQALLARKLESMLNGNKVDLDWEQGMAECLETIRLDTDTDALFRLRFLEVFLTRVTAGSTVLGDALRSHAALLKSTRINKAAPWMDPDNKEAYQERLQAARFLKDQLPSFLELEDALKRLRGEITVLASIRYGLAGVILADAEDEMRVELPDNIRDSNTPEDLYVISVSGSASTGVWRKIGSVSNGRVQLSESDEVVDGRLVFVAIRSRGSAR